METKVRYLVTKDSNDGTFREGDHIQQEENGDISCIEATGWIEKRDAEEATAGMEYEIDVQWIKQQKNTALLHLKRLGRFEDVVQHFSKQKR